MSADPVASGTVASSREVPPPAGPPTVRADDHGTFRAVDPASGEAVMIRPAAEGLELTRYASERVVAWSSVRSVRLLEVPVHTMVASAARIEIEDGQSLDLVRMHAAGGEFLPRSLPGSTAPLIRVERMRLLLAAIIARAGLAAAQRGVFERGPRRAPALEITPRPRVLPGWVPPLLLALSVVGLVVVLDISFASALIITAILFVHEYGHVFAMRAMGLRVRGVLFLPLLGAATIPEGAFPTRYVEARVLLAGPMTGLPLALVALVAARSGLLTGESLELAYTGTLLVNFVNLIPAIPLDGGRTLFSLTASWSLNARRIAQYTPLVLGALALLVFARASAGFMVGVFVVFSFVVTRLAFRRQTMHDWMETGGLDLAAMRTALRDVTDATSGAAREDIDGGVPPAPMTRGEASSVVLIYVLLAVTLIGIAIVTRMWPHLVGLA